MIRKNTKGLSFFLLLALLSLTMAACSPSIEDFNNEFMKILDEKVTIELKEFRYLEKVSQITSSYDKKHIADELSAIIRDKEKILNKFKKLNSPKSIKKEYAEYCKLYEENIELMKELENSIREDNQYTMESILNDLLQNISDTTEAFKELNIKLNQ